MLEASATAENAMESTSSAAPAAATPAEATSAAVTMPATNSAADTSADAKGAGAHLSVSSGKAAATGLLDGAPAVPETSNSQTPVPALENPGREPQPVAATPSESGSDNRDIDEVSKKAPAIIATAVPHLEMPDSDQESIDIGNNNSSHNSTASVVPGVASRRSSRRINQDQTKIVTPIRAYSRNSMSSSTNSNSLNESGGARRQSVSALARMAVKKDTFEIGELVWALNSGDPVWPARIVDPKEVHPSMREYFQKKKIADPSYYVFFYGDPTLSRLSITRIFPFKENMELFQGACKRKKFATGLELVLNHPDASVSFIKTIWDNCVMHSKRQAQKKNSDDSSESSASESEEEETPQKVVRKSTPASKKRAAAEKNVAASTPVAATSTRRTPKQKASQEEVSRKRRYQSDSSEDNLGNAKLNGSKRSKKSDSSVVETTRSAKKSKASAQKNVNETSERSRKAPKAPMDPKAAFISRMIQEIQPRLVALTNPNWTQPGDALRVIRFILQRLFVSQKELDFDGPPIADSSLHVIDWNLIKLSLDAIKDYALSKSVDVMALREHRIMRIIRMLHAQKYEPLIEKAMKENEIRAKLSYLFTLFTTYRFRVDENATEGAPAAAESAPAAPEANASDENNHAHTSTETKPAQAKLEIAKGEDKEGQKETGEAEANSKSKNLVSEDASNAEEKVKASVEESTEDPKEAVKVVPVVSDDAAEADDASRRVRPSTPTDLADS